jgi:hypothetical protein
VTNLHEIPGEPPKEPVLRDYLRPQTPALGLLLRESTAEWKRLRDKGFPMWTSMAFVALRIIQRMSYHRGWQDGAGSRS